ncbi:DUF4143 domain-containing protein [Absiella sp. AM54-8XD]|uniref:ATP-binding protein n=1 Tax=Absiella sp. AM54-8XD TaxID=2292279 RepID=UPI000E3FECFC|nr:AAA family ATPase [Absiella sp. AM54-8XD]RGC22341.1 DUF4143 domain-containing protein [Absiella sp. AM54-8XD]
MFKRKIDAVLDAWKNDKDKLPLVIKGPRQIGKTTSILAFGKRNYEHVVYINFDESHELNFIFDGNLDVDTIIINMTAAIPGVELVPNESLIILDEIQSCPNARTALKFFAIDGRFDVIASGSLLGINYKEVRSYPVGYEMVEEMHSFDFEEFLWALGYDDNIKNILKNFFDKEMKVPEAIHKKMMENFKNYIIVGGMPKVVDIFVNTKDLTKVYQMQKAIVQSYENDIAKYAEMKDKTKARACFLSIPKQLSKENKKFQYSKVAHGARAREYEGSLMWLYDSGIVNYCHNLSCLQLPLEGNAIDQVFKIYMRDTGLFMSMLEPGSQADILKGNLGIYKGAIYENIIADILTKMGRKLYYYKKGDDTTELDFVIRYQGACVPIEVKSTNGNAKAMKHAISAKENDVTYGIKLIDGNIGRSQNILTIPLYMAFLLTDY